ncbi:hypothetical protein B0J11DRAFT_526008 [Dendryphion nanum]|uniref:Clr5 domain-containing protein n=1 Tax=Dendryphion nanum TaxID=256645 RepID=A0A9P9DWL6_9PLEO|nr:hypothetical protein B0J11DRAFT_526008 [Dendryphion nanum]
MSRASRKMAPRIPDAVWEQQRKTIERLFLHEDKQLGGQNGVILVMSRDFNFTATKSQYENQFRKWRVRKNITRKEWRTIFREFSQRPTHSQQTNIVFKGVIISKDRIEREQKRYQSNDAGFFEDATAMAASLGTSSHSNTTAACTTITDNLVSETAIAPLRRGIEYLQSSENLSPHMPYQLSTVNPIGSRSMRTEFSPFSWATRLPWELVSPWLLPSQNLIHRTGHGTSAHNTLFYSTNSAIVNQSTATSLAPIYMVSALLNNMSLPGITTIQNAHNLLRAIPKSEALRFFQSLPIQEWEILRERMFAAAVDDGHLATIKTMLDLGINFRDKIGVRSNTFHKPIEPLQLALDRRQLPVLNLYISQFDERESNIQLNSLRDKIIKTRETLDFHSGVLLGADWLSVLRKVILAGADPTIPCIMTALDDAELAREFLARQPAGLKEWLRLGLLRECIEQVGRKGFYVKHLQSIFDYIFEEHSLIDIVDDPDVVAALQSGFEAAIRRETWLTWTTEIIFETCARLGVRLQYSSLHQDVNSIVIEHCKKKDWISAHSVARTHTTTEFFAHKRTNAVQTDPDPKNAPYNLEMTREWQLECEARKQLKEAIENDDVDYINIKLRSGKWHEWRHVLERAISIGSDRIAAAILSSETYQDKYEDRGELLELLLRGRTVAVTALMEGNDQWSDALNRARDDNDFIPLDDLLHRMQPLQDEPLFPARIRLGFECNQQIALHALAHYAVEKNDFTLFDWLLAVGLDMDAVIEIRPHLRGLDSPLYRGSQVEVTLPPLITLAIDRNQIDWVRFMLNATAVKWNETLLTRAVKGKASSKIITLLLDPAANKIDTKQARYGYATLREAIQGRDYDTMALLIRNIDLTGLVWLTNHTSNSESTFLSPLGEAIALNDLRAVKLLLEGGADPNAIVSCHGIFNNDAEESPHSDLLRVNPLLAAIDIGNMDIIRLLVHKGAELDYPPKLGLLRTPLQRAAEIGSFEIVQYFLDKNVPVDGDLFYIGGSPLQFAALGGYVGIAQLLLEHDADPNYLPAQGDGRTAFEAAAEWGRVDMMALLAHWGVDWELDTGDEVVGYWPKDRDEYEPVNGTQYERALMFAERRGHMASKRYVQHLRSMDKSEAMEE